MLAETDAAAASVSDLVPSPAFAGGGNVTDQEDYPEQPAGAVGIRVLSVADEPPHRAGVVVLIHPDPLVGLQAS